MPNGTEDDLPFERIKLLAHIEQLLCVKLLVRGQVLFQPQQAIGNISFHRFAPKMRCQLM